MDALERINLNWTFGHTEVQRWEQGNPAAHDFRQVRIGHTADGRWYVTGNVRGLRGGEGWLCRDKVHARHVAADAMVGNGWREAPVYGVGGMIRDPGKWRRVGGTWAPLTDEG